MNQSIYVQRFAPSMRANARQQSGATLIIVLILLILITLFGMASVRSSMLQERMVSGTISNNLAFQAAEAGLRQAEARIADSSDPPTFPDAGCDDGFCVRWKPVTPGSVYEDKPYFADPDFWEGKRMHKPKDGIVVKSGQFEITPKYIIEDFGKGEATSSAPVDLGAADPSSTPKPPPNLYRITAYAKAPGTGAETLLQSIYIR